MTRKTGLGRGLDALIPTGEKNGAFGLEQAPVEAISPNPRQPRGRFDEAELAELAESIRQHGVLQPLIVTEGETPGTFRLIAGERRLLAARLAGLDRVPIILREASDEQRLELALIENVQRADLSPLETAEAYRQLSEDFKLTHEQIAGQVGKSRVSVTNTLRLLNLPAKALEALAEGRISEGHARCLLALPTSQGQLAALARILHNDLSVRQAEELVRRMTGERPARAPRPQPAPEIAALEDRLQTSLGTRVSLKRSRKGGTITIHYYSDEELNALVDRLVE